MGYRSNSNGDSSAGNSPRSKPDKARSKRVRPIYQSNRQPLLFEPLMGRTQALTEIGEDIFS